MKAISYHISPFFLHLIRLCVAIKIDIDLVFSVSPKCDRNSSEIFIVKSSTNFNCNVTNKKGLRGKCRNLFARKLPLILTKDFLSFLEKLLLDVLVCNIGEHS